MAPVIESVDDLWDLRAEPAALAAAAVTWRAVADDARTARDRLDRAAGPLAWAGDAAESYRWHRGRLGGDLDRLAGVAGETAAAFDGLAALLRHGQAQLADAWSRIPVPHARQGGAVLLEQSDGGRAAVAEAAAIRADVDHGLCRGMSALARCRQDWALIARDWTRVATGVVEGWLPPADRGGLDATVAGGRFVVSTGPGDNTVEIRGDTVTVDGATLRVPDGARLIVRTGAGNDTVRVVDGTGDVTALAGAGDDVLLGGAGADVLLGGAGLDTVLAGPGDDRVSLGPAGTGSAGAGPERAYLGAGRDRLWGSTGAEQADGGAGDDLLFGGAGDDDLSGGTGGDTLSGGPDFDHLTGNDGDDAVFGGGERDYTDGGAGDDLVDGGTGDDTLYGLSGADTLRGGDGDDYLEGGTGDDVLFGGAGDDVLSGGRGGDLLAGGAGDDTLNSGGGADTVDGGAGDDRLFGRPEDTVTGVERFTGVRIRDDLGGFITVEGNAEFVDRVRSDLDLLRASPTGQQMLAGLEEGHRGNGGDGLTIGRTFDDNGYARPNGSGYQHPSIDYNPAYDRLRAGTPPVVVLFHEMAHVYDMGHGTADRRLYNGADGRDVMPDGKPVSNAERQAVGLPIDHDGDPATPNRIDPAHPLRYTENGLRAELGLDPRDHYGHP
ncbi:hypothetical protein GCM10010199_05380 [Dactylosporangium roseum]